MTVNYDLKIPEEKAKEMPMVDLAFLLLKQVNNPMYYRDIMNEIATIKGLDGEAVNRVIAQLYTEINIDGRFACVGGNMWGLKRWYPVEKSDEGGLGNSKRPRIINEDDDDLDEELFGEEEFVEEEFEATFDAEVEDFVEDDEFLPEEDLEDVAELDEEDLGDEELSEDNELEEEEEFEGPVDDSGDLEDED